MNECDRRAALQQLQFARQNRATARSLERAGHGAVAAIYREAARRQHEEARTIRRFGGSR